MAAVVVPETPAFNSQECGVSPLSCEVGSWLLQSSGITQQPCSVGLFLRRLLPAWRPHLSPHHSVAISVWKQHSPCERAHECMHTHEHVCTHTAQHPPFLSCCWEEVYEPATSLYPPD